MVEPALSQPETDAPLNERFHLIQAAPVAGTIGAEARELITSSEDVFVFDQSGRSSSTDPQACGASMSGIATGPWPMQCTNKRCP